MSIFNRTISSPTGGLYGLRAPLLPSPTSIGGGRNQSGGSGSGSGKGLLQGFAAVGGSGAVSVLYGCTSGAIGTIITMNKDNFEFFSAMERAIKVRNV